MLRVQEDIAPFAETTAYDLGRRKSSYKLGSMEHNERATCI